MHSDTKLTAEDATDAKPPANSTSPRPESNGRGPGPGFGPNPAHEMFGGLTDPPGLACNYSLILFSARFQNVDPGTKLTAMDATDARTPTNSTSPRPESNGRRPGAGFGQKSGNKIQILFCLPEQDRDVLDEVLYLCGFKACTKVGSLE